MKKRTIAVLLTLTILLTPVAGYTGGIAYAGQGETHVDEDVVKLQNEVEDMIDDLEDLMNTLERQKDIVDENDVRDNELEKAIEEVETLEDLEEPMGNTIGIQSYGVQDYNEAVGRIEQGLEKTRRILDIINRQIELKTQFVDNARNTYRLTNQVNGNIALLRAELKDIKGAPEREFTGEQFDQIRAINDNLKKEIRDIDYTAGQMAREMRRYIGQVRRGQFRDAVRTFENMVYIQERQIEVLNLMLIHTDQLLQCLYAV